MISTVPAVVLFCSYYFSNGLHVSTSVPSVILLSHITADLILQYSRACLAICVKYPSALQTISPS